MKHAFLVGVVAILAGSSLAGQGQGRGDQPPDFQTRMPWASWEGGYNSGWSSVPQAQQVSEPFKMFDNMYYVGLQGNSVLLLTTSDGLMLTRVIWSDRKLPQPPPKATSGGSRHIDAL